MGPSDAAKVRQAFAVCAAYYQRPLTDVVAQLYQADLDDMVADDVLFALAQLRRNPARRTCPLPAEVRDFLAPAQAGETAERIAARIIGAVSKYGYNNVGRAQAYIGDVGWQAVVESGGWQDLCRRLTGAQIAMCQAQMREHCRAILQRQHQPRRQLDEGERRAMGLIANVAGKMSMC